jgi:hypothetical protein
VAGIVLLTTALLPAPARADCVPPPPLADAIAEARVVFVGTVTGVLGVSGARFEVEEVWKGSLPGNVEVRGLADGALVEFDRQWQIGQRYLVLPRVSGGILRDDLCTATTPWRDELASLRPETAPAGGGGPASLTQGLILAAAMLTLIGIAWWVATRQDERGRSDPPR